jgi:hypothetical protein
VARTRSAFGNWHDTYLNVLSPAGRNHCLSAGSPSRVGSRYEVAPGRQRKARRALQVIALGDTLSIAFSVPRGGIDRIGHALRERFRTVGQDRRQPESSCLGGCTSRERL